MTQENPVVNTSAMYGHGKDCTQVYVVMGPKGSKLADGLKTIRDETAWPQYRNGLMLPPNKGFVVSSWPTDPRNISKTLASIATFLENHSQDGNVLCAVIFGEAVDFSQK